MWNKEKRWLTNRIIFHLIYPGSPTLPAQINDSISWGQRERVVTTIFGENHIFAYSGVFCIHRYPVKIMKLDS